MRREYRDAGLVEDVDELDGDEPAGVRIGRWSVLDDQGQSVGPLQKRSERPQVRGAVHVASTGTRQVGHAERDEQQEQRLLERGPGKSAAQRLSQLQPGEGAGQCQAYGEGSGR